MKLRNAALMLALVALLVGASVVPNATSRQGGIPSSLSDSVAVNGCSCHTADASSGVALALDAPANFTAGETYTLTITMESDVATDGENQGGFFLSTTQGSLASADDSTQVIDGYMTHTLEGNDQRSWNVSWTAPADDTRIADFTLFGNSVNGNGAPDGGDQWNRATFAVPGANAVVGPEEISDLRKALYLGLVVIGMLAAVVVGNRMVSTGQSVEQVFGDFWGYLKPWLTTTDHKRIGLLYIGTGLFFFFVAGTLAMMMRFQLLEPDNDFMTNTQFNSAFTMHGTTMVFMAGMPIIFGFANYLVPLQIGARDLAFPRLNALSFWLLPTGALVVYAGYFAGGAGDVGWTGYTPYSSGERATSPGTDLWVAGQIMLGASSTLTAINFLTMIMRMRAPGVTLMRMPLFTWSITVAVFLLLLAIPVFTIALILLYSDRTFGSLYFSVEAGADPVLWQHLFWYFGHPEVYVLILPAFGVISDVVATFARRPIFGYTSMVYAMVSIGLISYIVYGHHMFTAGTDPLFRFVVMLTTMLVAVPTGVKIFNWLATLMGGSITTNAAMLFSLGAIATFTIGGITGIVIASIPMDIHLHDTYFIVAHFHYVLIGGTIFGFFSGIYYWFPKVTGRFMDEKIGTLHFIISFIAFHAAFYPMHILGMMGMPRRYATYDPALAELNVFVSYSAFVLGAAQLLLVWNILRSWNGGEKAGADPWGGWSLEWTTSSPPPPNSFLEIPTLQVAGIDDRQEAATTLAPSAEQVPKVETQTASIPSGKLETELSPTSNAGSGPANKYSSLSGIQKKITLFIYSSCEKQGGFESGELPIKDIAEYSNTSVPSTKKSVQRLIQKRIIGKVRYKNGRGGWTVYSLDSSVSSEILAEKTGDKSMAVSS